MKKTLKKAKESHTDRDLALLCLRETPIDNIPPAPAELLLGRPVQDNLPRQIPSDRNNDKTSRTARQTTVLQPTYHRPTQPEPKAEGYNPEPENAEMGTSSNKGKNGEPPAFLRSFYPKRPGDASKPLADSNNSSKSPQTCEVQPKRNPRSQQLTSQWA